MGRLPRNVDETIKIVETGNIPKCLKRCERIVAELRKGKVVGEALAGLIEPFLIHANQYRINERAFAEDLKEHLEMLRYALRQILGEEADLEKSHA